MIRERLRWKARAWRGLPGLDLGAVLRLAEPRSNRRTVSCARAAPTGCMTEIFKQPFLLGLYAKSI